MQQQQQQQQQQHQHQHQQQHQHQHQATSTVVSNANIPVSTGQVSDNATAEDLLSLQLEQERHNRMLQMVQADRQERAVLANQEAMMKKKRRETKSAVDSVNSSGLLGDSSASNPAKKAFANQQDAMKNMFSQLPSVSAGVAFPNASLLANANTLANAAGLSVAHFGAAASKLTPGFNQSLTNALGPQGLSMNTSNTQNGLLKSATHSTSMSPLGSLVDPITERHFNQKHATRGAAIVPCRARGMPVDHNFKTAYFVIPESIEHGDELMCSYPACRQAGVKFRYCLHCKYFPLHIVLSSFVASY